MRSRPRFVLSDKYLAQHSIVRCSSCFADANKTQRNGSADMDMGGGAQDDQDDSFKIPDAYSPYSMGRTHILQVSSHEVQVSSLVFKLHSLLVTAITLRCNTMIYTCGTCSEMCQYRLNLISIRVDLPDLI